MRLWWNGIHCGLKIRRRKLASSNLASRTISLQSSRNAAFLRIISILFLKGDIYNVKDLHIGFPVDRQHTAC